MCVCVVECHPSSLVSTYHLISSHLSLFEHNGCVTMVVSDCVRDQHDVRSSMVCLLTSFFWFSLSIACVFAVTLMVKIAVVATSASYLEGHPTGFVARGAGSALLHFQGSGLRCGHRIHRGWSRAHRWRFNQWRLLHGTSEENYARRRGIRGTEPFEEAR